MLQKTFHVLVVLLSAVATAPAEDLWSLQRSYLRVLERSESLFLDKESIKQAESQWALLRSGVLPRVGFKATGRFQDTGGDRDNGTGHYRPEAGFYLRQPIFSGLREYAGLQGQRARSAARVWDLARARQKAYEDVAEVFFTVVEQDRRLESLGELRRATEDRLTDLRRRVAIGRSRRGEVLSTESQWTGLRAREEQARGARAVALEILRWLVDAPVDGVVEENPSRWEDVPSLETCLAQFPRRPDLRAVQEEETAARFFESATHRQRWPTLNLEGNYYTRRTGSSEGVDWDAVLNLDVPFYRGGQISAESTTARSQSRSAALRSAQARRIAEREVRVEHQTFQSARAQARLLEKAAALAEENVRVQREDYRLGITNNLEVLSALNAWEEAKLVYDAQRLEVQRHAVRLAVAVGNLPEAP